MDSKTRVKKTSETAKERKSSRLNVFIYTAGGKSQNCHKLVHNYDESGTTNISRMVAGEEEIYQCSELQQVVNILRDENACPDDIDEAGQKVLIALYGRKKSEETRDSLIFKLFQKSRVKNDFILVFLPHTTAAAREHSLRAYLQVQHWSGFAKRPLDWCWKESKHGLFSVITHKDQLLRPFCL
ncbi:hypothetical protein AVEN_119755-1 [Araneus ventricosus]|uniref:Uncharacterized protein n=1 Tax=Araneus ventricosus TaxID=182803 RepID=A0A4Y2FC04_ARAVE|nr:hypothetical protein AVEN_119755-1 [Araneus ventricosus]